MCTGMEAGKIFMITDNFDCSISNTDNLITQIYL